MNATHIGGSKLCDCLSTNYAATAAIEWTPTTQHCNAPIQNREDGHIYEPACAYAVSLNVKREAHLDSRINNAEHQIHNCQASYSAGRFCQKGAHSLRAWRYPACRGYDEKSVQP